jgi:2-polyprenyl-3-methyl-5-hydroxy-6-metoxy-1,4-benzoquinol methylase
MSRAKGDPEELMAVSCAHCGETRARRRWVKFDLPIAECLTCGLVRATPRCSASRIAARYSADYFWNEYLPSLGVVNGQVDYDFIDGRYAPWIALAEQHVAPRGRLLEIGTGAGLFAKAFARAGWSVVGVEVNAEGAQFARDRLGLDVRQQYAEDVDLPNGSQDVVAIMDVIEHVSDPAATVATALRFLRPGGVLLIQTPNLDAFSRTALGEPWAVLSPAEHLYYFTERTLAALVTKAGFRSVTFEWQFPGFGPTETMNARYTHAPDAVRAKAYGALVKFAGPTLLRWVRATRRTDQLIALATA